MLLCDATLTPGLYPFDSLEAAQVDEIIFTLGDIGSLLSPSAHIQDQEVKKAKRLEVVSCSHTLSHMGSLPMAP